MVIKRKDFQKAAAFIHEFLLKLNEDVEGAELRDTLNLALLHMQKYYRALQNKSQEKNAQSTLPLSARGLSPMTPFFDAPDKFQWKWLNLDSAKIPATFSVEESVNLTTLPPFIQAARSGDVETVAEMIQNDPSVTYEQDGIGRIAVNYAVHFDHLNTLHCLLEGKTDVNITAHDASTPLHQACHDGNELAVDLLLRYGADMTIQDTQGRAPIHWAVTTKSYECLRILINNRADVNVRDIDGLTPCMWACRMDHIRHFELLCQAETFRVDEPDGIERDEQGRTWMHWAVRRTQPLECLQTLLTRETAKIKDTEGKTVLLLAAEMGSLPSCKLILEIAGQQCITDCDNVDRTALHLASMGGHGDILNFLLENGADLGATDKFNATPWDYARNRQLHYCQLIIMSHQRQRYQSNPATPIFNGFTLDSSQLMNGDIGSREYDSYSMGSRSRASSLPITPPHPPKKPRTSKLLGRRALSLTSPVHSQEFDDRETSSADGPRRKERIEVSVAPRRGPPLRNYRQDDIDMASDENEEDEDVEGVSVGGMDVSDIDDDQGDIDDERDTQQMKVHPSPRPAPRHLGARGQPQPHPRYRPKPPPSYTQPLEPRYNHQEDYSEVPNHWENPPQSPQRRSLPAQRYRTQSDPLRSTHPHPPSHGGQRQHPSHQSPPQKRQPAPPPQPPPPPQYQPHPPRPGSGDSDRPNSGPKQREQALSPNQSSQGSDPPKPVEKPGSGGTHRHSPPGVLEGRKIPPPLLTPLHNAPRLPTADAFEEVERKKKKKKKKQPRDKDLESLSPPPPPQHPSDIPPPRGFAMNLQPPPSARPRAQSGVPAPRYSKSEPQKHDQRHSVNEEVYMEDEHIKDTPMLNGHAVQMREKPVEQEDPSSKSQPMDSEDVDDDAMENTTEEDLVPLGPLIPPPQGFRGSQKGQRPLSQSYPKDKSSAALQMKPTSAKPPIMPRSRSMGRSSTSSLRSSGGKSASPGRRHRSLSNS